MAKKITVTLTEAQARALLWAMETFDNSYVNYGDVEADRAVRLLEKHVVPQVSVVYANA